MDFPLFQISQQLISDLILILAFLIFKMLCFILFFVYLKIHFFSIKAQKEYQETIESMINSRYQSKKINRSYFKIKLNNKCLPKVIDEYLRSIEEPNIPINKVIIGSIQVLLKLQFEVIVIIE